MNFTIGVLFTLLFMSNYAFSKAAPYMIQGTASPNGEYVLRVHPAKTCCEEKAKAVVYKFDGTSYAINKEFPLINRMAPSTILITNIGTVFTFDDWGMNGIDKVISIYTLSGDLLKSLSLEELYSREIIKTFDMSTSSIYWRDLTARPWTFSDIVCVKDSVGGSFAFDVESGEYEYSKTDVCKITL